QENASDHDRPLYVELEGAGSRYSEVRVPNRVEIGGARLAEPSGTGDFRDLAHHVGDAVLQVRGEAEDDGVAESRIGNLGQQPVRPTVAKFERASTKNVRAEVEAEPETAAIIIQVVVPLELVLNARPHAVDSAAEALELLAAGDRANRFEELRRVEN